MRVWSGYDPAALRNSRNCQMKLGVYADLRYIRVGNSVSTDNAFGQLLVSLAQALGGLRVFGRTTNAELPGAISLPADLITFVALPAYDSLHRWTAALPAFETSLKVIDRNLSGLDGIWIFGPHPLAGAIAKRARRAGVRSFLGVRQHFPEYVRGRFHPVIQPAANVAAFILERTFRHLGQSAPTVVVGDDLARRWRSSAPRILAMPFAIITSEDVVPQEEAGMRPWHEPVELLTVTRLEPEKNPLLLAEMLTHLGKGFHLRVAGDGDLHSQLREKAVQLGVDEQLELLGQIPFGPRLRDLYRTSDCFVHVSHTEGVPQVLYEAMAAGIPMVATDVGGVRSALGDGQYGLLVPPREPRLLVEAVRRLAVDPTLRRKLALSARAEVQTRTLEIQVEKLITFFDRAVSSGERNDL